MMKKVCLPTQAVALLHDLKAANRGGVFVFENDRNPERTLSENAVLALIGRLGYRGRMTGHGFRSIASTWANKQGYNPDVIELALAHVPENQTRAAYNRNDYFELKNRPSCKYKAKLRFKQQKAPQSSQAQGRKKNT